MVEATMHEKWDKLKLWEPFHIYQLIIAAILAQIKYIGWIGKEFTFFYIFDTYVLADRWCDEYLNFIF